jgi:hypothetical protein
MALLKHHIFEQSLAWLAGLHSPKASPALRALPPLATNEHSLAAALAVYGGYQTPTDIEFLSLEWLEDFARSGRQLLLCHAMTLLEAWTATRRRNGSLAEETEILNRLSLSAGQCANVLPEEQLRLHGQALDAQIQRVLRLKTMSPVELRTKAMALLQVAEVLQHSEAVQSEARRLLDQALPQLIATDGGPIIDDFATHILMVQSFLAKSDLSLGEAARNALDRARPFLAMLMGPAKTYCVDTSSSPAEAIGQTAPLRFAPQSQVARLTSGKTIAIAMPAQGDSTLCFSLFSNSHTLCTSGLFQHAPDDELATVAMTSDSADTGQWLQHETCQQKRTVFMTRAGDDIRVEDQISPVGKPAWMRLHFAATTKVSVTRNGTQATIALDGRNLWQLSLRGGHLITPGDGHHWLVKATGPCVNWALKRIAKPGTKHKAENLLELPF